MVPHIVRTQVLDRVNLRAIDTGAGTQSIALRHVPQEGSGANPATNPGSMPAPGAAPAVRSPAPERPNVGTVPGQSAMVAAPAALRQLSTSADANGETAAAAIGGHPPSPPAQASTPAQANTPAQPSPPAQAITPAQATPISPISPPGAGGVSLMFSPLAGPVAAGSTFQLPVVLTGGTDIASVPMEIKYDPAHLSLVNLAVGDLLGRDGKAVTPVHRDSGPGLITMNAARPPGTVGISGAGVVYLLSFQAKAAGESIVTMTRAATVNSAQQQTSIQGARITIQVK